MSDEPIRIQQATTTPAGIWEHPCQHDGCSSWGGHGYQIGGQAARWFCHEHLSDGERLIGYR